MKVVRVVSGQWFPLQHTKQVLICCDCGLAHEVDFELVKGRTKQGTQIFQLQARVKRLKKRVK
jgi:hypothetical protein